jgi:hypothetical protein
MNAATTFINGKPSNIGQKMKAVIEANKKLVVLGVTSLVLSLGAGCSPGTSAPRSSSVHDGVEASLAPHVIDVRREISHRLGVCSASPLVTERKGVACNWQNDTSYELSGRLAALSAEAVKWTTTQNGTALGRPVLEVTLDNSGREHFASVTRAHLSQSLAFLVEGRVVSVNTIAASIGDGRLLLTSPDQSVIRQVAASLGIVDVPGPNMSGRSAPRH